MYINFQCIVNVISRNYPLLWTYVKSYKNKKNENKTLEISLEILRPAIFEFTLAKYQHGHKNTTLTLCLLGISLEIDHYGEDLDYQKQSTAT